ncbi:MAG: type I-B CRISPR-associated protein Cas7/Cst2/DevR, partial [Thermaerobacter sp.]|nr:type I-B CRISPR-associated protein Cas7/Cst2/DevR [Thermaerobacter sp.]
VSTLVGLQRGVEEDFGTMARQEGDAVPHQHEFYRTVLRGALSLDLDRVGTFTYRERTGYRNLDEVRRREAQEAGLEHREEAKEYRLPREERARRVACLLRGLGVLAGGAKQSIHYTDVTPVVLLLAVVAGGNNPLSFLLGADVNGQPAVDLRAVEEFARVWHDQVLSPVYAGWVQGFQDAARERLWGKLEDLSQNGGLRGTVKGHPREVLESLVRDLEGAAHGDWLA